MTVLLKTFYIANAEHFTLFTQKITLFKGLTSSRLDLTNSLESVIVGQSVLFDEVPGVVHDGPVGKEGHGLGEAEDEAAHVRLLHGVTVRN